MVFDYEYPHTSLCKVVESGLKRLADVVCGEIQDSSFLPCDGKDKFFCIEAISVPQNFIGIWGWRMQEEQNEIHAVVVRFYPDKIPIEIIIWDDCSSEEDLISRLKQNDKPALSSGRALLSYAVDGNIYRGLLCIENDLFSVAAPQFFSFNILDCVSVDEKIFYSKLTLDIPDHTRIANRIVNRIAEAESQLESIEKEMYALTERVDQLEQAIEFLQDNRDESAAQLQASPTKQFYRPGKVIELFVDNSDLDDFICAFEDALDAYDDQIDHFAKYLRAAYDNHIPLMLVGPNGRRIADAFSIALNGSTAATFDCAAVNCLDDLNIISSSNDPIIAVLNPFAPNFIAYLPELLGIEGKFFIALYPFVEDLRLEPRSFFNYFTPVFTELIFDQPDPIKILTSSINSTDHAALFAAFPMAYVNGLSDRFVEKFRGSGRTLDRLKKFLGDDQ